MKNKIFIFALALLFSNCKKDDLISSPSSNPTSLSHSNAKTAALNSSTEILGDMAYNHERKPKGVPESFGWLYAGRVNMGNDPKTFKAFMIWGHVYETVDGSGSTNTRVQIRPAKAYYLSKSQKKWVLLQSVPKVSGAHYLNDYANNSSIAANIRTETSNSISTTMKSGYNFHFWDTERVWLPTKSDIAAIWTTCSAKLILNDSSKTDDRDKSSFILGMGADYWSNLTDGWDNFKNVGDVGIGRFKYVTKNWRAYNMTTATKAQLDSYPPPVE